MRNRQCIEILIHIAGWVIVFGFPYLMMTRGGFDFSLGDYLMNGCIVPISFLIIFYVNYFLLIPHLLFEGKIKQFLVLNIFFLSIMAWGAHTWQSLIFMSHVPQGPRHAGNPHHPPQWIFLLRDFFSMVLTAGLSIAIKLSIRWREMDEARREAEKSRTEAELKNLRNQLNPHFLLNTLNNIYALIAFDGEKAQMAVQELSKLLRHLLYDNQQPYVSLHKEMDFIRNYIELMRIRLNAQVTLDTQLDIPDDCTLQIAPLIFISLIENAFKHGISPTQPSSIHICFSVEGSKVTCDITNSNFPKNAGDKSGSGIGLEQVKRRLELTYPGHYLWFHGVNEEGTSYNSHLCIDTEPEKQVTATE